MSLYSDSPYPVEDELASIHARQLDCCFSDCLTEDLPDYFG